MTERSEGNIYLLSMHKLRSHLMSLYFGIQIIAIIQILWFYLALPYFVGSKFSSEKIEHFDPIERKIIESRNDLREPFSDLRG